jgi:hypothetical protein
MDFSPMVWHALQEKLDVGVAYPVVYTLPPITVERFVHSMYNRMHDKMLLAMGNGGELLVAQTDVLGLSLLLMKGGVKLPPQMLYDIAQEICDASQHVARWIAPMPHSDGDLWYCRLNVDFSQEEAAGQD